MRRGDGRGRERMGNERWECGWVVGRDITGTATADTEREGIGEGSDGRLARRRRRDDANAASALSRPPCIAAWPHGRAVPTSSAPRRWRTLATRPSRLPLGCRPLSRASEGPCTGQAVLAMQGLRRPTLDTPAHAGPTAAHPFPPLCIRPPWLSSSLQSPASDAAPFHSPLCRSSRAWAVSTFQPCTASAAAPLSADERCPARDTTDAHRRNRHGAGRHPTSAAAAAARRGHEASKEPHAAATHACPPSSDRVSRRASEGREGTEHRATWSPVSSGVAHGGHNPHLISRR